METASCRVMAPASFSAITSLCTCAVHAVLGDFVPQCIWARGWALLRQGNALLALTTRSWMVELAPAPRLCTTDVRCQASHQGLAEQVLTARR